MFALFFFFSSRRRHTRWPRDWSSDVCSSDLPEFGRGDGVDGLIELKGLLGRQVPEQLLLVAEHERDAPLERRAAVPGRKPRDVGAASRGVEQSGEHLEGRRLARAVGPEKRHDLAALDLE